MPLTSILFLIETVKCNQYRWNYLKKKNAFCQIFKIWPISKKKITLISDLFLRLRSPKNVVRWTCKNFCFKLAFQKEHGKWVSGPLKSQWQHLYYIYWSIGRQLSCKKSVLVISKILRLFVNTLSAVDKYSLSKTDLLKQPIQMQISQKQKLFVKFFVHLWNLV